MKKIISIISAVIILIGSTFAAFAESPEDTVVDCSVSAAASFVYRHDPMDNPYAMKDIVRDESAVYGFRPSDSGSLKQYADVDWSDPDLVASGREERIAYHNSIESMYEALNQMVEEGSSSEEIARAMSMMRNDIRIESYKDDPERFELMKARNLEKYGHEEGPLPDELYEQYGSWDKVTEKAFSTNVGMDACLGLYDDYYFLYVALGQVDGDDTIVEYILGDADADGTVTIVDATIIQRHLAGMSTSSYNETAADADEDVEVTITDATAIRRFLAQLPANENIGKPIS